MMGLQKGTIFSLSLSALLFIVIISMAGNHFVQATFPGTNGKIAFESNRDDFSNMKIFVMDANGGSQTKLTDNVDSNSQPSWSPDGTKIAFASNRNTGVFDLEIYVMDANGGSLTKLTDNDASDSQPSWSPDGTKIAFASNRDGLLEIYVMDANGGSQTNLSNNPAHDLNPSWSPDGTKIAFVSLRDGDPEIYVMDANGESPTKLTNNDAEDSQPSWSPDGTKIAFASNRNTGVFNLEIYVMDANGGSLTKLTDNPALDFQPSWSPDGTKIAFASDREVSFNHEIYVMDANGGSLTKLTDKFALDFQPSWQPIPNRRSGGTSFDVTSPTINKINYYTVQDGTQKEGVGGILANFYNELPTQTMNTGEEQRLQISVSDNNGIAAITRVVVNMYFDSAETKKGDTYFVYSEKEGLTESDPYGIFGDVKVHRTFTETEMILVFSFTPQKPTPPISLAINGLDIYGNNQNNNIPNAFQIVGEPNTNNLIIPDSAEIVIPYYLMPYYEIPEADSEGNLIYYNTFGGLEQKQVHPHYEPTIYPDDVGKDERHDDGFYDKVLAEEDKAKQVASAIMVHPIYSGEQKIFKTDKVFKYPSTVGKADRSIVDAMKELMHKENVKAMQVSKRVS